MNKSLMLVVLLGCTPDSDWVLLERPADYSPPPGTGGAVIEGPTAVMVGSTYTWTVTAPDIVPGARVDLAWGGEEGPGPCPYRRLVGGSLCMDVANPAHHMGWTTAVAHPTIAGQGVAVLQRTVPLTTRDRVYLQGITLAGPFSATTQAHPVDIVDCDPMGAPYGGGTGSPADPYLICAIPQLAAVNSVVASFLLVTDLDMAGAGVGNMFLHRSARFDGGGHTLSNYDHTEPLFGSFGGFSDLRNLTMSNVNMVITAPSNFAYGPMGGSVGATMTMENLHVQGSIDTSVGGDIITGGMFGNFSGPTITNATVDMDVTGTVTGGFAGNISGATISDVHVTGSVSSAGPVGGFVGEMSSGTITDSTTSADVTGVVTVGGFLGAFNANQAILIEHCAARGTVSGLLEVGGFVGRLDDALVTHTIRACSAWGSVSGDGSLGGFVGVGAHGVIEDSYATGAVTNTLGGNACAEPENVTGGFVGEYNTNADSIVVRRSIAAPASVDPGFPGFTFLGGTCGLDAPSAGYTDNVYVYKDVGALADIVPVTEVNAAPESSASYAALDFVSTWSMPTANPNNPHGLLMPVLTWECGTEGIVCP